MLHAYIENHRAAQYLPAGTAYSLCSSARCGGKSATGYLEGEPFDPTGMIVTAYYDNDTSAVVTPEISCDTSAVGTQTVTLTYGGETLTFEITVQEDPLPGLAAQIVFTYDEETRTAVLTNVPESVRTVLAGYAEDKMILAELWDTAGNSRTPSPKTAPPIPCAPTSSPRTGARSANRFYPR